MTRTDHTRACNIYWEHLGLKTMTRQRFNQTA
jgi:hypothetical protein